MIYDIYVWCIFTLCNLQHDDDDDDKGITGARKPDYNLAILKLNKADCTSLFHVSSDKVVYF